MFEGPGSISKFAAQTAKVQGGLALSRMPDSPQYKSPGKLAHVDMKSCYPTLIERMNAYLGLPVVLEPGRGEWTLKQSARYASRVADPDAWFLRVTGHIDSGLNLLLMSPEGTVTHDCFRRKKPELVDKVGASRPYSHRVESAVVTWHTWEVIRRLPKPLRNQYEALRVGSMVMYPRAFVAEDGRDYDDKVRELRSGQVDWEQILDLRGRRRVQVDHLDEKYVALRCSFGPLVRSLINCRRAAEAEGELGLATAAKRISNCLYGVLAGKGAAANVVMGQVITSCPGRSVPTIYGPFGGLQVVTDGLVYARDKSRGSAAHVS